MADDQDDLISTSDEESLSENEDQCLPTAKSPTTNRHDLTYVNHTKNQFVIVKLALILSTLGVVILLPIYTEKINVRADVYSLFFINTLLSSIVLMVLTFATSEKNLQVFKPPVKLLRLVQLSGIYFIGGLIVLYAIDRRRVVCHVQDPLKGLVLVWSFLFYFFFCKRFMCIQRIFSSTIIIVGLFIGVDYSLCNEFKCRGYERQLIADDKGPWSWTTHIVWTFVYVGGLALFAAFLTLMEQTLILIIKLLPNRQVNIVSQISVTSASALTNEEVNAPQSPTQILSKKINPIHLAMWLHIIGLIFVICFYSTDYIPGIAKGFNNTEIWDYSISGLRCHFSNSDCGNVVAVSWLFLIFYVIFVISTIQFVILTQSAVYATAVMATALPLAGIWWSLFQLVPNGQLVWGPAFSGDLISSLIGFCVILIGLYFLQKSHLTDFEKSKTVFGR